MTVRADTIIAAPAGAASFRRPACVHVQFRRPPSSRPIRARRGVACERSRRATVVRTAFAIFATGPTSGAPNLAPDRLKERAAMTLNPGERPSERREHDANGSAGDRHHCHGQDEQNREREP